MTTYYIDPDNGNDSLDGLSPANALLTWTTAKAPVGSHTYRFKRGCVNPVNNTGFHNFYSNAGTNIVFEAYYNSDGTDDTTKSRPVVNRYTSAGNYFGFYGSCTNVQIRNIIFKSNNPADYAFVSYSPVNWTITNCDFIGTRVGFTLSTVAGYNGDNIVFTNCNFNNTQATNENSAVFIQSSVDDCGLSNLYFKNCTIINSVGYGFQIKPGGGSWRGHIRNLFIHDCIIDNTTSAGIGIFQSNSNNIDGWNNQYLLDTCEILRCTINNTVGSSVTGRNITYKNNIISNNSVKGTGAGSVPGAWFCVKDAIISDNISFGNIIDGPSGQIDSGGIYFDVMSGSYTWKAGCENVICTRNIVYGNKNWHSTTGQYLDTWAKISVNPGATATYMPMTGIRLYLASNVNVFGNIIYNNPVGVAVYGGSNNNIISNNVIFDNPVGVWVAWNTANSNNLIVNNVIINNEVNYVGGSYGDVSGANGTLSLSATTGYSVLGTFSSSAYINNRHNHIIREVNGTGWGVLGTTAITGGATTAYLTVKSPFSKTSYAQYEWIISGGENLNNQIKNNISFNWSASENNAAVVPVTTINQDPLLDSSYKPLPNSPCLKAGKFIGYYSDATGRPFNNPPSIGAYEDYSVKYDNYTE